MVNRIFGRVLVVVLMLCQTACQSLESRMADDPVFKNGLYVHYLEWLRTKHRMNAHACRDFFEEVLSGRIVIPAVSDNDKAKQSIQLMLDGNMKAEMYLPLWRYDDLQYGTELSYEPLWAGGFDEYWGDEFCLSASQWFMKRNEWDWWEKWSKWGDNIEDSEIEEVFQATKNLLVYWDAYLHEWCWQKAQEEVVILHWDYSDMQGDSYTGYLVEYEIGQGTYMLVSLIEYDESDEFEADLVYLGNSLQELNRCYQ